VSVADAESFAPGSPVSLRLPATSANLGPGFDTLALALGLYLEIEARPLPRDPVPGDQGLAGFSIEATGRNVDICSRVDGNLLLEVYRATVRTISGREAPPLALTMRNGIPLGMGCGSSAASRLAGVALAAHFGAMDWTGDQILAEASRLEGHPDNAAACWLGGFVASGWAAAPLAPPFAAASATPLRPDPAHAVAAHTGVPALAIHEAVPVAAVSIAPPRGWHALLVLPAAPLATTESRAVLPDQYSRRDAVLNLQRTALLTAAFAAGRGDLLRYATGDSLHQPYRAAVCALLPRLLPLAGQQGILSVTLSGAGPAVLLLLEDEAAVGAAIALVHRQVAGYPKAAIAELLSCPLSSEGASLRLLTASFANISSNFSLVNLSK
jgi:homoserine kinase